jgi:hypothetical protein
MTTFRAIAGVSSTLRSLLRDRMELGVDVSIAPPDVTITGMTGRRVNLYLYQVSENGFLRNQEIPGQGHPGDYGRPPLSLDLQYLVTSYGSSEDTADADLEAQQILGDAMRVFHDHPIVSDSLHQNDDPTAPLILDPTLVGEFEQVKITLQPATLEEFSKIWTALPEVSFRRSVAYQISVVQIESQRRRPAPLPVRERRVYALPLQTPHIAEIVRVPPFDGVRIAVAEAGDRVEILGRSLRGAATRVTIDGVVVVPVALTAERIEVLVPGTTPAGVRPVRVVHDLLLAGAPGQPPAPHRGFESNVVPLVVVPRLVGVAPDPAAAGTVVTATVAPPALARQEKTLLLGDFAVPAQPVPVDAPPSATIDFRLPTGSAAIPVGVYFARVRIDGAESRLTVDPVTTQYDGPTFTVT